VYISERPKNRSASESPRFDHFSHVVSVDLGSEDLEDALAIRDDRRESPASKCGGDLRAQ
jgi:hypothetical protein